MMIFFGSDTVERNAQIILIEEHDFHVIREFLRHRVSAAVNAEVT